MTRKSGSVSAAAVAAVVAAGIGAPTVADARPNYPREHIQWCLKRYWQSYDAMTNTYLREDGKRAQCVSPYIKAGSR